ncbi:MAG: hypothetical protein AAF701_08635 [Pseudomonadota bacterium]
MDAQKIEPLFTRADGAYMFARWGRPIAPVVFGVESETLALVKGAVQAICAACNHQMAETDPELGSNLMVFFARHWNEYLDIPDLDRLIPDLHALIARLKAADANQYRIFRFDEQGAIKACFVMLCMDDHLQSVGADTLVLSQMVQSMVLWSDRAFQDQSPLAMTPQGHAILRPEISVLLRAVYDPILPAMAQDASHALRVAARISAVS